MSEGTQATAVESDRTATPLAGAGLAVAAVAFALAAWIYYPLFFPETHRELANQSEEFFFEANEAAGAPVLVLSLWLFYRRSHLRDVLLGPGSPVAGLGVLLATALLYGWGHYTKAADLQLMSVLGLLFGTALLLGGRAAVRAYWVPILFLAFALPLPPVLLSAFIYPIQLATAEYAGFILNAIGVASYVQGDQILRPENTFIVIETCSGVRTIVTLSMLTVLLIDLFERSGWHAALLMLLAPVVAFITNGFRVVTLVLNPHSSIHSIHNLQGIAMLLVGLTAMYLLDGLLERVLGSRDPSLASGDYGETTDRPGDGRSRALLLGAVVAVLLLMIGTTRVVTPWQQPSGFGEMPDDLLARVFGERQSRPIKPDYQFRGSIRYLAHANRRIRFEGEPMEVFLGVANEQIRSHTVLSKRLAWPESGFAVVEESRERLGDDGPEALRMVLRRGARSVLSYSWYEREGSLASEWLRQATALDRSPMVRPEHMLAIRISTPLGPGGSRVEQAERRIRAAWKRLAPELERYAPTFPAGSSAPAATAAALLPPPRASHELFSAAAEKFFLRPASPQ